MDIIAEQIEVYKPKFLEHGGTPMATAQNDRVSQHLRLSRLVKNMELKDKSIHDVGCGICDLYPYLKDVCKRPFEYVGTEVISEMIDYAENKYDGISIYNRNILESSNLKYDFNVASGLFFIPGRVGHAEWKEFCFAMMDKMFEMSNEAMSFNFLTANGDFQADDLFYINPGEVFDYCLKHYSRFVMLDNAYPLYEFTITVFQEEWVKQQNPETELSKYLK